MPAGHLRFGRYLRALREARRFTLAHVEEATRGEPEPLTRSFLCRLETGKADVSATKLLSLARLYGIRVGLLAERFELDTETERLDREGAGAWEEGELLVRAAAAGRAGEVRRALLLYEQAEGRARSGGDAPARRRARLGVARALAATGRIRSARAVVEDLLGERLEREERAWGFFYFARTSFLLGQPLIARAAHLSLREVPRPWPAEVEAAAPAFEGEFLLLDNQLGPALSAFLGAVDAARGAADPSAEVAALFRLAQIARRRGRAVEALEWIERGRGVARAHGLAHLAVQADIEEGRVQAARGRGGAAREAWIRARHAARRLELYGELFDVYLELWRLARAEHADDEARVSLRTLRRLALRIETLPPEAADVVPFLDGP